MSDDEWMAAGLRGHAFEASAARRPRRTHLRLVRSDGSVPSTRIPSSRWSGVMKAIDRSPTDEQRRLPVRHPEGKTMKTLERLIHTAGRFAVGFGIGLALVCAFVIVTTTPALDPARTAKPVGVVRLDPVTVAISADRFHAIQAEMQAEPTLVQTRGESPLDG